MHTCCWQTWARFCNAAIRGCNVGSSRSFQKWKIHFFRTFDATKNTCLKRILMGNLERKTAATLHQQSTFMEEMTLLMWSNKGRLGESRDCKREEKRKMSGKWRGMKMKGIHWLDIWKRWRRNGKRSMKMRKKWKGSENYKKKQRRKERRKGGSEKMKKWIRGKAKGTKNEPNL